MKETSYGFILAPKKYPFYMFLKINDVIKESQYSIKIMYISLIHFQEKHIFGIQQSHVDHKKIHNVVQLNLDQEKYYLLTPYPILLQSLKEFSPEIIRANARNPNIDLQSIGIYSKSDIQNQIRRQQL